jgi:hypothetical protein
MEIFLESFVNFLNKSSGIISIKCKLLFAVGCETLPLEEDASPSLAILSPLSLRVLKQSVKFVTTS